MTIVATILFAQSLLGGLAPLPESKPVEEPKPAQEAPGAKVEVEAPKDAQAPAAKLEAPKEAAAPAEPEAEPAAAESAEPEVEEPAPKTEETNEAPAPEVKTKAAPDPEPTPEPEPKAEPAPEAALAPESDAKEEAKDDGKEVPIPRSVKITSDRTDYDRREGVIMFDRNVFVEDAEYKMHSDQLYVFLDGTNELKRIVAIGNVAITNDTRVGSCAKAAYTRSAGKVVMYGNNKGVMARLADMGKRKSEVEGRKITFWISSEQVEVEGSTVTLDTGGISGKEGAKMLLGK